jgi:hypothetical protein
MMAATAVLIAGAGVLIGHAHPTRFLEQNWQYGSGAAPLVGQLSQKPSVDGWYCGYEPVLNNQGGIRWNAGNASLATSKDRSLFMVVNTNVYLVGTCVHGCDSDAPGAPAHCVLPHDVDPLRDFPLRCWKTFSGGGDSPVGITATAGPGCFKILHRQSHGHNGLYTVLVDPKPCAAPSDPSSCK